MGAEPIFAQALKAVNPLPGGRTFQDVLYGRKGVERARRFCYNPPVLKPGNGLRDPPRVGL
jgi:hypothetical protein